MKICSFYYPKNEMKLVQIFLKRFSKSFSQIYRKQNIELCKVFVNLILRSVLESTTKGLQTVQV
jgi:hypothetical protein